MVFESPGFEHEIHPHDGFVYGRVAGDELEGAVRPSMVTQLRRGI